MLTFSDGRVGSKREISLHVACHKAHLRIGAETHEGCGITSTLLILRQSTKAQKRIRAFVQIRG